MKRILLCALAALALTACREDDDTSGTATETETPQAVETTSETTTADDGGGAMDGAAAEESSAPATDPATLSEVSQDAIDGCIDALRAEAGSVGGTVQSTEFSEANSLVMLEDDTGTVWRCLVSNDGSGATVEAQGGAAPAEDAATADDGGGAMDGAASDAVMPSVGSPTDVTDFVGAPAGQAPGGLAALGFESVRSEGLTTYWFNSETGACARMTTSEGVYSEVVMVPAEDC